MEIAEVGEAVLGPKLIGFQVGNEPDLYAAYVLFDSLSFFFARHLTTLSFFLGVTEIVIQVIVPPIISMISA
jgi:hypothetical protein